MAESERDQRLQADLEAMRTLAEQSDIFDFDSQGDPPNKYVVTFRGKGLNRALSAETELETIELHRVEIRLPFSYPKEPPSIRWKTPVFHPNISFSGTIRLKEIGLPWEDDLPLDAVCERLWDVVRMAHVDYDRACNHSAKNWFQEHSEITLPVDTRPLRGGSLPSGSNVIHYKRRPGGGLDRLSSAGNDDVFYIGEDTPTPEWPMSRPGEDDDVFYIGDE